MKKFVSGFSLVELMVSVAIVGILTAIAYPSYQDSVTKSRRARAQAVLEGIAGGMERYFVVTDTYVGAATSDVPLAVVYNLANEDATVYYNFTATGLSTTAYSLFATPVSGGTQVGDGAFTLTSIGVRAWDENDTSSDGYETSW